MAAIEEIPVRLVRELEANLRRKEEEIAQERQRSAAALARLEGDVLILQDEVNGLRHALGMTRKYEVFG